MLPNLSARDDLEDTHRQERFHTPQPRGPIQPRGSRENYAHKHKKSVPSSDDSGGGNIPMPPAISSHKSNRRHPPARSPRKGARSGGMRPGQGKPAIPSRNEPAIPPRPDVPPRSDRHDRHDIDVELSPAPLAHKRSSMKKKKSESKLLQQQQKALNNSKKQVDKLKAALGRAKKERASLRGKVAALKHQIQVEQEMDYDFDEDMADEVCMPVIGSQLVLFRGGVRISGALFLVSVLHTCERLRARSGSGGGGGGGGSSGRFSEGRDGDAGGDGGDSPVCAWCSERACREAEQSLRVMAVDMGMGILDMEIDALVSEIGAGGDGDGTGDGAGGDGTGDGAGMGLSVEQRLAIHRAEAEPGMLQELQCEVPPGDMRFALLEAVETFASTGAHAQGDVAALLGQMLYLDVGGGGSGGGKAGEGNGIRLAVRERQARGSPSRRPPV